MSKWKQGERKAVLAVERMRRRVERWAVRGTVVKARNGWAIVEFPRWAGEGTARVRFVDGAGWDQGGENMGILGIQGGDFYRIVPIEQCPPREDESASASVVRALRAAVVGASLEAL